MRLLLGAWSSELGDRAFVLIAADFATIQAMKGTFANLADGSTVTVGVNKFKVSYEGGDGNDLTLRVVP